MIEKSAFTGWNAFDIALGLCPSQLKREAQWICRADGRVGHATEYAGTQDGLHMWKGPSGYFRLTALPYLLSREEDQQIEDAVNAELRREWERMVGEAQERRRLA